MKFRTLLLLPLIALAASVQALNPYGFETFVHLGHVYARSVVTTEDGKPIWAEYNDQGGHSKINSVTGIEGFVLAASQVNAFLTALELFRTQLDGDVELMTVDEFNSRIFQTSDGRTITNWPTLPSDAISIVIPGKAKRHSDQGAYIEYYSFPVNMLALPLTIAPDEKSMLFDEDGKLIYSSSERIGYLTAFYLKDGQTEPDNAAEYQATSSLLNLSIDGYKILAPVSGVFIEAITGYVNSSTYSDQNGSYILRGRLSPCPGFSYQPAVTAYATLYYANFNPRGSPRIPYYLMQTSYNNCVGYGLQDPIFSGPIIAAAPENITTLNYAVGINVLSGRVLFAGTTIGDTTEYSADVAPQNYYMAADDYDGDGEKDKTVRGTINAEGQFEASADGSVYGVYFSANERSDGQPNITRIMDLAPDLQHKGLLKTVSLDDVKQTDILVFRESTGELIMQRSGLTEHEHSDISRTELDGNNNFAYTLAIRSPEDMSSFKRLGHDNFVSWQASNKISPALQSYKADFLRTGEQVRVVAINRPTGYIGTATTVLTSATDGGDLTVRVPPVVLTPPNLKVWATRRHQGQGLLKNTDEERTTISNEGAAITDDSLVEIHTEWLDQGGYPLPAGLAGYGYTGRLTRQIDNAGDGDPYDNSVSEFDINPGRQLQVLNFDNTPYHHYLQVNGYPSGEQNDFSAGDHTGALRHRPAQYVPVRVPLYNEQGSIDDKLAVASQGEKTGDLTPRFNWVYRPELSFSVVDLELDAINLQSQDENGNLQTIDISDSENPVISSADDLVQVIFNLIGSEYDRITALDGEQHYIFALGDQEIEVRIDKGEGNEQQIQFANLDYLSQLEAEDYLTLSLYLNQDAQNVLWEWGVESAIYIEKTDPDYPDVALPWDEYYPNLGNKDLVIRSARENSDMVGRIVQATITSDTNPVGLLGDNDTNPARTVKAAFVQEGPFIRAHIKLAGRTLAPSSSLSRNPSDSINIQFELLDEQQAVTDTNTQGTWYVRNNANTRLQDVIQGKAVYAYDNSDDDHHKSLSSNIDADDHNNKRFDFVQALFNQVIPRKRTVTAYTYTQEDGIFGDTSRDKIQQLKQQFHINNTRNSASSAFNKLMKDYRLQSQQAVWANRIVDKTILIGSALDISSTPNSTDTGDTGIYELYVNGVQPFVNAMLSEADRYAGDEITANWIARTGEGSTEHGAGMSYCFGCKQTVEEFNSTVVNCRAETRAQIQAREATHNDADPANDAVLYRGNVNAKCQVTAQGAGNWAGLVDTERAIWVAANYEQNHAFNPANWSGIDCSGLVEKAINGGRDTATGLAVTIPRGPGRTGSQGFFSNANYVYFMDSGAEDIQHYLRKGDLVRYSEHVSIVHENPDPDDDYKYRIIHAYGITPLDDDGDRHTARVFSRKVMVTRHTIKTPTGYGRIRLWN